MKAYELDGCVWYQYQPKILIQEHHHTATVAMGLLASKEDRWGFYDALYVLNGIKTLKPTN